MQIELQEADGDAASNNVGRTQWFNVKSGTVAAREYHREWV